MPCVAGFSLALGCPETGIQSADHPESSKIPSRLDQVTQRRKWAGIAGLLAFLAALIFAGPQAAHAQSAFSPTFTPQAVGTSATTVVTVTAAVAGTVDTVKVLTGGAPGGDFAAASGSSSCASASLLAGQTCQQSVAFTPAYPGIRTGAVVLSGSGKVLGVAYISGMGTGGLPVLVNGNMIPAAGSGAWDELEDGEPATSADLNLPASVVLDGAGNMYIADSVHHRVRMVSSGNGATISGSVTYPPAGIITTIAGTGEAGIGADGVPAYSSALDTPAGLAVDGAGNLYIADTGNSRVRVISATTGLITTIATGSLNQPWGVTVDAAGNLFIADTYNHRILRVDGSTQAVTTIAGSGSAPADAADKAGDGGPATSAQLNRPHAVAFDAVGNMYIPDTGDNRIRKVSLSGTISTFAGTGAVGFSADGTLATSALMWAPSGVIVDAAQNVYVSDTQNNAVRKISVATGKIATVVQTGKLKNVVNKSLFTNSLYGPIGLALDGNGNLYFADYYYMRIREIQSSVALMDFTSSAVRAGSTSTQAAAPPSIQVENDGNASFSLGSITPTSNSAVNPASTTCQASETLAVGIACTITPQFAPTVSGNPLFGEVDVAELTTNPLLAIQLVGNATPINSTTTTLTSNHDPSNFGQSVTFTATVNTGAGTGALTGTVSFFDGTTTLQTGVHLTASSIPNTYLATFSTPGLSVGVHSITATYSGDAYHLPTDPNTDGAIPDLTQVVNEVTSTTVSTSANPSALGNAVTLTAKVIASGGGGVAPDGMVSFNDGASVLGSAGIDVNGLATFTTTTLAAGTHAITASYPGDTAKNILGSNSAVLRQDVQAASTVLVQSNPNPSTYGTSVTFSATVTSGGGMAATGTVTFLDGAKQIGSASLAGTSGVATFVSSTLSAGSHAITASYAGDQYSGPGVSAPIIQVVNLNSTVTVVAATPNPGIAGKPVVLTVSVRAISGSGAITGTVTFTDGGKQIGSGTLSAGSFSISPTLAPGAHAIVATYNGDSNDTGSASAAMPLAVNPAKTAVTVQSSTTPSTVLSPVIFTATVTGNGGTPTGSVTFGVDGATAGTATLNANGTATLTSSALKVGAHNVTATYTGDTNDAGSVSGAFTQTVDAITTTTSLGQSSTTGVSPQVILVAAITGGPTPTGTVTFSNGSQTLGAAPVDTTGVATLMPDLAPGTYNIVASYGGDADHNPSTSSALKISGTPVGFAMTIDPPMVSMASSENVTIAIKLSSNNGYADTIGLGCGTLPAGVTCHFDSSNVALKSGQSVTAQLTIDTNSPLQGGATAMNSGPGPRGFNLAGLFLPAGLLLGSALWRFRRRNAAVFGVFIGLLAAGAMVLTGCGGFTQSKAAPGTYTVEVTGVGSNSNITHYQNITLTITK